MSAVGTFRLRCIAGLALAALWFAGPALAAEPANYDELIAHADKIKSSDNAAFIADLGTLDAASARLGPAQREYVAYLHAWQVAYFGNFETAVPQLNEIFDNAPDVSLRIRAGVTSVNALSIAAHYQEAYSRLSQVLDLVPKTSDAEARMLAFAVASFLYERAGQYELAIGYANRSLADSPDAKATCKATQIKLNALYRMGSLPTLHDELARDIQTCVDASEPIWAALMRVDIANMATAQGRPAEAIQLLQPTYDQVTQTKYPRAVSAVDSALAQAYWKSGDGDSATKYAQHAIASGVRNEITEPLVEAYRVLYEAARSAGDNAAALSWHERYAAADKGYLNDESAHALAYQMVKQQVLEKKALVDVLSQQNQVLKLKQAVNQKNMIAVELGIALLMVVLGSIALYAYRTKRSQLKFQKLARRDGLTEIFNRQYFVEVAEQELEYCRKSVRDVSVVAIDLDHFKLINDGHGHAAGDFALQRAVAACQQHLRSVDVFGRLGGEEFGILMPDCVPERAIDMAEKMRLEIASLQGSEGGPEFPVTASFGVTAARWSGYNLLQLLAQADSALYQAKREGRNRVVVHAATASPAEGPASGTPERRRA